MTMNEIRWEKPPPSGSHSPSRASKWRAVSAALRLRPGEWAVVAISKDPGPARRMANLINVGKYADMPAGAFEAVSRKVDGEYRVYARYVGGAS